MKSYRDLDIYNDSKKFAVEVHSKFGLLSKRINKFIQWVEDNWNKFPSP